MPRQVLRPPIVSQYLAHCHGHWSCRHVSVEACGGIGVEGAGVVVECRLCPGGGNQRLYHYVDIGAVIFEQLPPLRVELFTFSDEMLANVGYLSFVAL